MLDKRTGAAELSADARAGLVGDATPSHISVDLNEQLDQKRRELDCQTALLTVIADWRDDIRKRFERAKLRYELLDTDPSEIDALNVETAEFALVCKRLQWRQQ